MPLALFLCAALMGFAQQKSESEQTPETQPVKPEVVQPMKPMQTPPASVDPHAYRLGPDDVIGIQVWREADLTRELSIRPDGRITLPLAGELKAADLTPVQLGEEITKALTQFINNPQVTVTVLSVRSKRYYISGEVGRPGAYPLASPITVFEALTMAGGFRDFANKKKIVVVRGAKRFKFNWNEVVKGKNLGQNIQLESGDQILVP